MARLLDYRGAPFGPKAHTTKLNIGVAVETDKLHNMVIRPQDRNLLHASLQLAGNDATTAARVAMSLAIELAATGEHADALDHLKVVAQLVRGHAETEAVGR